MRRIRSIAAIALACLVAGGCATTVDPYHGLAWIDITTDGAFAPIVNHPAIAMMDLGAGDELGVVTYESYLAWLAPADDAVLAGVPVDE
jgi:hypothetical protein